MARRKTSLRPAEAEAPTFPCPVPHGERVAVVDIGSNSIRLVVFEGLKRVPTPVFNEKVICGLGRELHSTGRLSEESLDLALPNLERFARLARGMGIERIVQLATAAAREAENGAAFVAEVERRTRLPVQVLSGEEEARIAAEGVLAGTPGADGVMGDLGGGSLELVRLEAGEIGDWVTLPLGPLRLAEASGGSRSAAEAEIERALETVPWLAEARGGSFYAVGGAWRAVARVLMDQRSHPLPVIHSYSVPAGEVEEMMRVLAGLGKRTLSRMPSVSRRRVDGLPYGASLLRAVTRATGVRSVVWSSYGLREGYLYTQLSDGDRRRDPLLATAAELSETDGRFVGFAEAMSRWTAPLMLEDRDDAEEGAETRLRLAAAYLADISWREHPDHRARQAVWRLLYFPFAGIEHAERAFLAYAVFSRYGGGAKDPDAGPALALLSNKQRRRARCLGLAMRLAFALAGGVPSLLESTALGYRGGTLLLRLPKDGTVPHGTAVERRFAALRDAAELPGEIEFG